MNEADDLPPDNRPQEAACEEKLSPIPLPTLAEAMKFRREQTGETIAEIARRAGIAPHVWAAAESGWHELNLAGARRIYSIGIPAEVILRQP